MGRLTAYLIEQFRLWDRRAQAGLLIALVLMIPALITAAAGPQNLRMPATVGFMGLIISAQVIIMWANRGMVTDYTQAQRFYLDGDFAAARDLLERMRARDQERSRTDFRALTLLGNTYRQLGDLERSAAVLSEAVNNAPNHYFSLYGFGRTLLVQGRYQQAADTLEQALANGAAPAIQTDAGEAHYRSGDFERAQHRLLGGQEAAASEPHRALMTAWLLHRLGHSAPPSADVIAAGLPYWQAQARLFAETPYGADLAADLSDLQGMA
ncbi:MAG: tetratricopeptide repeat protein [Phototrophicaceae bacterium]